MAAKRTGPLSSSNNAVSAPGTALSHVRESWSTIVVRDIEALPARLGFGAIQRVDDGSAERDHQIGMILGKEGERRCCVLSACASTDPTAHPPAA